MTDKEFDSSKFTGGLKVVYKGEIVPCVSSDFEERAFIIAPDINKRVKVHCSKVEFIESVQFEQV